jgi:hypothetical protein
VNNQAPELSPEARRIISEARGADDPSAEDRARVKARWLASVAAVAGVSSLTEAARAAGGIGWGLKAAGTALAIVAGVIGLYVVRPEGGEVAPDRTADSSARGGALHARFEKTPAGEHRALERSAVEKSAVEKSPVGKGAERGTADAVASALPEKVAAEGSGPVPPPSSIIPAPPGPTVEAAPPAPSVLEPTEVATLADNVRGVEVATPATEAPAAIAASRRGEVAVVGRSAKASRRERVAPRARAGAPRAVPVMEQPVAAPVTAGAPSGQLGEELALLSEVRGSVQGGEPRRALELLSRYRSQFGRPILGMEADALKVDALCKAGQRDAARAGARAFQNDWPGSPLERRVSSACP